MRELLLHEVDSEARDFVLEVNRLELTVLHVRACRIELEALTLEVSLGALDKLVLMPM